MVDALEKLSKGAEIAVHQLVLVRNQGAELQAANAAALRRKSHKRKRVQREGILTAGERARLTTLKEFAVRIDGKKAKKSARFEGGELSQRRCGRCGEAGHNARTCKQVEEVQSD
jgi:hypothetical protein